MKNGKDGTQKNQFCFKNSKLNIWHTDSEWWSYFKCRPLQLFHSDEGLMLRTSVPKLLMTANLHYKLVNETKLSCYNLVCYSTHNWSVQVFFFWKILICLFLHKFKLMMIDHWSRIACDLGLSREMSAKFLCSHVKQANENKGDLHISLKNYTQKPKRTFHCSFYYPLYQDRFQQFHSLYL